eukprot:TRINITY_DN1264_c2_g6_i1.p1 TRINITY_DN1264_c2_g6~~TRINITY_DN1264_c2_g6_i1.p1  ORF type:complete len:670 (-),score=197.82 TRINITY_DN1264_c2_g6_i1:257-2266(-)
MSEQIEAAKLSRLSLESIIKYLKTTRGKVLSSTLVGTIIFTIIQRYREKKRQKIQNKDVNNKNKAAVNKIFLKRLVHLIKIGVPSLFSKESLSLTALTMLLLTRTYLTLEIAEVMGGNAKYLVEGKLREFIRGVLKLGLIAIPASIVNSGLKYFTSYISLLLRKRITEHFHQEYLSNMTFYRASNLDTKIDNCDQRITNDIKLFSDSLADLYTRSFKPFLDVILFSRKLNTRVGFDGPTYMFLFYLVSGMLLRSIMPSFASLISQQQKTEGDFNFCHNRIITHAEEIAFYGGSKREKEIINDRFDDVFNHSREIYKQQAYVNVFDGWLVKYGSTMIGYAIVALPVFGALSENGKTATTSERTRDYIHNTQILINLAKAIGQIVLLYKRIMTLAGYTHRISELYELLGKINSDTSSLNTFKSLDDFVKELDDSSIVVSPSFKKSDIIAFENVSIVAPDGQTLVKDLSFEVNHGDNLLISGPNGSGKSSLFRVLSELWPLQCGTIYKPNLSQIFYIPQRPYLAVGSLRDQVIYPHSRKDMKDNNKTDEDLEELLDSVELKYILKRYKNGWDAEDNWADALSGGEKQRMAMARVFYHKPKYAILDECTSAVSIDVEGFMYQHSKDIGITLITVSHRKSLWRFHEHVLFFDGHGGWKYRPLTESEKNPDVDSF